MTDRTGFESDLEERLRRYFARELDRASRDLALQPLSVGRTRGRSRPALLLVPLAGLLIAAVVWVAATGSRIALPSPAAAPSGIPSAPAVATATARSLEGGCGTTTILTPPAPVSYPGLDQNPWARAEPASAGILALFWGNPPYLAAGTHRPDGSANKVLWVSEAGSSSLQVAAHLLDRPAAPVNFTFPASGFEFPSTIDLPEPGCWRLDLTLSDGTTASIALVVAPNPEATPTASPSPTLDPLAALRRPFRTPALGASGECPATPVGRTIVYGSITYASGASASGVNQLQGQGPVYLGWLDGLTIAGLQPDAQGWYGDKFLLAVDQREYGPILLRGERLDQPGPVAFSDHQPEEVVPDPPSAAQSPAAPGGSRPSIARVHVLWIGVRSAGCYVLQADGATSSTTIVFRIEPQPVPTASLQMNAQTLIAARPFEPKRISGSCPVGPVSSRAGFAKAAGDGTVFLAGGSEPAATSAPSSQPAIAAKTLWVNTDPAARPALIRGARVDGVGTVTFKGGVDIDESYLLLAGDSGVSSPGVSPDWQQWPTTTTFSAAGCYEFQIDGVDYSERLFVNVTG